ncbi:hypothetical protein J6590_016744 [Homalodisca vitripennis]|nr:hypothetical protein J6590_016744 [Homalodisca vitripennis]
MAPFERELSVDWVSLFDPAKHPLIQERWIGTVTLLHSSRRFWILLKEQEGEWIEHKIDVTDEKFTVTNRIWNVTLLQT